MNAQYNPYEAAEVAANINATAEAWKDKYEELFIRLCHERESFDGSVPCAYARQNGLWEPHHHNCWVSMPTSMSKKGYATQIKKTTTPGSSNHSHNNNVGVWVSNLYQGSKQEVAE